MYEAICERSSVASSFTQSVGVAVYLTSEQKTERRPWWHLEKVPAS